MNIEHAKRMLSHLETTKPLEPLQLGPRLYREIELRIRELKQRHKQRWPDSLAHKAAMLDLQEISKLEELLRTSAPRDTSKVNFVLVLLFAVAIAAINIVSAVGPTWAEGHDSVATVSRVQADPAYAIDTTCMPYHDAARCLETIKGEANRCVAMRYANAPTEAQTLDCIRRALDVTGANEGDDAWPRQAQ